LPSAEGLNGNANRRRSCLDSRMKLLGGVAPPAPQRGSRQLARGAGRRLVGQETAFTLIELLVAAAIFAVALTAILALLDSANQTGYKDQERNTALNEETNGIQRVYAPDSYVTTSGKGLRWSGGIVAANFESNDNDIIGAAPAYGNNPTHSFYGTAYHECSTAASSGTDPGSGCY